MIPDIGIANGVMSVILNYFKAMPDDIKFDVCYFAEKSETRKTDIEKLGGRVFKIPAPSPKGLLRRDMSRFLLSIKASGKLFIFTHLILLCLWRRKQKQLA